MKFKSSDIVKLVSGSPCMTVSGVSPLSMDIDRVHVLWFDKEDNVCTYVFNSDCLVKVGEKL